MSIRWERQRRVTYMLSGLSFFMSVPSFFQSCHGFSWTERRNEQLLSGEKPFFNIPNDYAVYPALNRGERPQRPKCETADTWLSDNAWKLVQGIVISVGHITLIETNVDPLGQFT